MSTAPHPRASASAPTGPRAGTVSSAPNPVVALMELSKARLSALVVATTAVGFLAATDGAVSWRKLLGTLAGATLCAWGANAFNQWIERERDARMRRTRCRPLPAGDLAPGAAILWAATAITAGTAVLAATANALTAALALTAAAVYVLAYTPLKTVTPACTLVGAVSGSIPPMMGWTAATGRLDAGAWMLGALLYLWQIPHFLALGWMYRDDYARGGFRMLPVVDPSGRRTAGVVLIYLAALLPVGLLAPVTGVAGGWYAAGSAVLGGWLLVLGARLYAGRTEANARRLFFATIAYLPVALIFIVIDPARAVTVRTEAVLNDAAGSPAAAAFDAR